MSVSKLLNFALSFVFTVTMTFITPADADPIWGRLANYGFINQRIKATLFFAGQALDGVTDFYHCNPGSNVGKYSLRPGDEAQLKWSENFVNQILVLRQMMDAGINVVNMSSWGEDRPELLRCAWARDAAPMQTASGAHDELFRAAVGQPILIAPFLETRGGGAVGSVPWAFSAEFPLGPNGAVAPGTVSQIVNLISRYLQNSSQPEWAEKWARVYNQFGEERYAIVIIHASSDQLVSGDDAAYAAGLDTLADTVEGITKVKVGFFIDAVPPGTSAPGVFKPSSKFTGPELRKLKSLLGVECFIPEVFIGSSDTGAVVNWKKDFSSGWFQTGVPFLMDVSSGYDARPIFGREPPVYGFTSEWLSQLGLLVQDYGQAGMVFNSWNGYTEGLAAVPSTKYGSIFYDWLQSQKYDVYAPPYTLGPYVLN
jgi:hypothetical protein